MKNNIVTILLLLVAAIGLSGCAHHHSSHAIAESDQWVKAADWTKMETATVVMSDFAFNPPNPVFRQGVPYKLVIENRGTQKHYFTAGGFFKAIATRKLQSNIDGEVKAPYFHAIEVYSGRSLDLYFVPVQRGVYELTCTIEGHIDLGMKGTLRIE